MPVVVATSFGLIGISIATFIRAKMCVAVLLPVATKSHDAIANVCTRKQGYALRYPGYPGKWEQKDGITVLSHFPRFSSRSSRPGCTSANNADWLFRTRKTRPKAHNPFNCSINFNKTLSKAFMKLLIKHTFYRFS